MLHACVYEGERERLDSRCSCQKVPELIKVKVKFETLTAKKLVKVAVEDGSRQSF